MAEREPKLLSDMSGNLAEAGWCLLVLLARGEPAATDQTFSRDAESSERSAEPWLSAPLRRLRVAAKRLVRCRWFPPCQQYQQTPPRLRKVPAHVGQQFRFPLRHDRRRQGVHPLPAGRRRV